MASNVDIKMKVPLPISWLQENALLERAAIATDDERFLGKATSGGIEGLGNWDDYYEFTTDQLKRMGFE
jgi:hypothetical protein